MPATYIHSLLGSRNWVAGMHETGMARTINRETLALQNIDDELPDAASFRADIFNAYCRLIKTRRKQPAFHPNAGFEILNAGSHVFAIKRFCDDQEIVALTNISRQRQLVELQRISFPGSPVDLLTGRSVWGDTIELEPYQYRWLV